MILVLIIITTRSDSKLFESLIPFDAQNSEIDQQNSSHFKLEKNFKSLQKRHSAFHQVRRITNLMTILRETDGYTLTHKRNSERI